MYFLFRRHFLPSHFFPFCMPDFILNVSNTRDATKEKKIEFKENACGDMKIHVASVAVNAHSNRRRTNARAVNHKWCATNRPIFSGISVQRMKAKKEHKNVVNRSYRTTISSVFLLVFQPYVRRHPILKKTVRLTLSHLSMIHTHATHRHTKIK